MAPKPGRIMGLESGRAGLAGRDERHAIPQEKLRKLIYARALAGRKLFLPALLEANKMQRRMLTGYFASGFIMLYAMTLVLIGAGIYGHYDWIVYKGQSILGLILYDLAITGLVFYDIQAFYSLVGKVTIEKWGIQVFVYRKLIFQATWDELEDIGIVIDYAPSPIHALFGTMFFSKRKLHLDPEKGGRELRNRFTNSHRVIIQDLTTDLLKPDLMQYIPQDRFIWIKDKIVSEEEFYRLKYQTNWDSKE